MRATERLRHVSSWRSSAVVVVVIRSLCKTDRLTSVSPMPCERSSATGHSLSLLSRARSARYGYAGAGLATRLDARLDGCRGATCACGSRFVVSACTPGCCARDHAPSRGPLETAPAPLQSCCARGRRPSRRARGGGGRSALSVLGERSTPMSTPGEARLEVGGAEDASGGGSARRATCEPMRSWTVSTWQKSLGSGARESMVARRARGALGAEAYCGIAPS